MIGAGAKILGNIEIGHCARIAAGSVVIKPVPNNVTVAGVPAKVVGEAGCAEPSRTMDQMLSRHHARRLIHREQLRVALGAPNRATSAHTYDQGAARWTCRKSESSTPI